MDPTIAKQIKIEVDKEVKGWAKRIGFTNFGIAAGALGYIVFLLPDQAADLVLSRNATLQESVTHTIEQVGEMKSRVRDAAERVKQFEKGVDDLEQDMHLLRAGAIHDLRTTVDDLRTSAREQSQTLAKLERSATDLVARIGSIDESDAARFARWLEEIEKHPNFAALSDNVKAMRETVDGVPDLRQEVAALRASVEWEDVTDKSGDFSPEFNYIIVRSDDLAFPKDGAWALQDAVQTVTDTRLLLSPGDADLVYVESTRRDLVRINRDPTSTSAGQSPLGARVFRRPIRRRQ